MGDGHKRTESSDGSSVLKQCLPIAYSVASRSLGKVAPNEVEDVAMMSIMDAWKLQIRGEVEGLEALQGLVAEIARRRAIDLLRHRRAGVRNVEVTESIEGQEDELPAAGLDVLGELDRREVGLMLGALMKRLSEEEHRLLLAFYVDRMKQREIAEAFNLPPGTVAVKLARARQKLRASISGKTALFRDYL